MRKERVEDSALIDAVVDLTGDVLEVPGGPDLKRLRRLAAVAMQSRRAAVPEKAKAARSVAAHIKLARDDEVREETRLLLDEAASEYHDVGEVLEVYRRDSRDLFLEERIADSLSGIIPSERIGPFIAVGGAELWFDIFFLARHFKVIESGASDPGFVLTKARPPQTHGTTSTMDIEEGTVWIRGDLIDSSLPAGAYVGIKVLGGTLKLEGSVSSTVDTVKVAGSLKGELTIRPALEEVEAVEGACKSAKAEIVLPDSITFTFGGGGSTLTGTAGKAGAWGQGFEFTSTTGSVTFIDDLWLLLIEYDFAPDRLTTDQIKSDLVSFKGKAKIKSAGLALPVIVPPDTSILGSETQPPGWLLKISKFSARWYYPDQRFHNISNAWVGIFARGVVLLARKVKPLDHPIVKHEYNLWEIFDSNKKRLPWSQSYEKPFLLFYRCDIIDGEQFAVTGQCQLAFDRPLTTDGLPIEIPANTSMLFFHRFRNHVKATFGAVGSIDNNVAQFALRNALVWTTPPAITIVTGYLTGINDIDKGKADLLFGVYGWAPTLPDPYVGNVSVHRPDRSHGGLISSLLACRIEWNAPGNVRTSFDGLLSPPAGIDKKDSSDGHSRPAHFSDGGPDIGPTQTGQGQLHLDEKATAHRLKAAAKESSGRDNRTGLADEANRSLLQRIDGYMSKFIGPTPPVFLLDVSTNQDLFGVALGSSYGHYTTNRVAPTSAYSGVYRVMRLDVYSRMSGIRVITLPQVQWEPVRTLDEDQDIMTLGWFPTPLASATDGGATVIGTRSQRLVPVIPEPAIDGTCEEFSNGEPVIFRTTLPFGLLSLVQVTPAQAGSRTPDSLEMTRPRFPDEESRGGIQITARAEIGHDDPEGISPYFLGLTGQLINGVDLTTGAPLGLSVLGSTGDPNSNVETIFNNDMNANPKVPVTRFDLSGYGGSNFSDWNNPFAAFAEAAKVKFHLMIGRTALEVIKVNSVLHPWGIRVTRSVTIERRPGGGVIRRDSGWQAFTPGMFDYRYIDDVTRNLIKADYRFDAGLFKGLFNVRTIRPAPGTSFSNGSDTLVPYYFDADVAIEGVSERVPSTGILGYLQTEPNGEPASTASLQSLIESQGPIGGPIDVWLDFGGSGLPYRATRIEVDLAMDGAEPIFVATLRGVPKLPTTGSWTVATRQVSGVPAGGGEANNVSESRGVPLIRRYPISYEEAVVGTEPKTYSEPPHDISEAPIGDYRFADAADLLVPDNPANEYALLQNTPTHAFIFPRPYVPKSGPSRIMSDTSVALADIIARSTSKGSFPPRENSIELTAGSRYLDVGSGGTLALSSPISIVSYPTPLRIAGSDGHGSKLSYDDATLEMNIEANQWSAEFTGLKIWNDILGLEGISGTELRVVGSTNQQSQIAELKTLVLKEIEEILQYIPIFGQRGVQGPIDLGASNANHEVKIVFEKGVTIPGASMDVVAGPEVNLKLYVQGSSGWDLSTGLFKSSATFGASLDCQIPVFTVAVVAVFIKVIVDVSFSLTSQSGEVTSERLDLLAFIGVGVEGQIGPFEAYSYLGIGFVLVYEITTDTTKYGGLVRLEAGINLRVVNVKVRAELQGLVYNETESDGTEVTKCDYSGKVKVQVDIFLIISISASYQVTETTAIEGA